MLSNITVDITQPAYDVRITEKNNIIAIVSNVIGPHEHENYYTKSEADLLLANKQDINSYIDGGAF